MKRVLLGILVIVHGLAHAASGVWLAADGPVWMITAMWGLAMLGYLAAGFGMLRTPVLRRWWKQTMVLATVASIVLFLTYLHPLGLIGSIFDLVLLLVVLEGAQAFIDEDIAVVEAVGVRGLGHPWLHRAGWTLATLFLVYAAAVVVARPTFLRWGTTPDERIMPLPGDDPSIDARYRVDHAITIRAPADSVWPWLVQLGQDRGGFYSYSWLERLVGDEVTNADRIHPEWQQRQAGDTVYATQPGYLGASRFGWRVTHVVPNRALVLENWGSFVLQPIDSTTTRLIIRTRGEGKPSALGLVLGPVNVFVFEPAHFIMQTGMLRGIRERAEGRV
ncbi:MAG: hypothetical protein HOQ11_05015 [Gemmatimonadaceae bacterium]|nr:hypothetical protein [Gemmatimonadaceae bacterium]NUQ91392.1 hypothetical protein [Gemmatimonadaceae bacterium]NUR20064.1 hypothetical protein [Gemmatimonadaceae bacterium]NUS96753.1 hypothetical protein [Gemmatimonadaceae bacterium]